MTAPRTPSRRPRLTERSPTSVAARRGGMARGQQCVRRRRRLSAAGDCALGLRPDPCGGSAMAKKKIAIVCTGAVGGYAGAHMVKAGEDVTFIDFWPEHVEKMKKDGLTITHLRDVEPFTVPVRALHVTEVQQLSKEKPIDIAFVCTKSYDTAWAATLIKQYLAPDGYIVSLQNCRNGGRLPASSAGARRWARSPARSPSRSTSRGTSPAPAASTATSTTCSASARCTAASPSAPRRSAPCSPTPTAPRSPRTCGASAGRSWSPT